MVAGPSGYSSALTRLLPGRLRTRTEQSEQQFYFFLGTYLDHLTHGDLLYVLDGD
jgi:hypothetical protein